MDGSVGKMWRKAFPRCEKAVDGMGFESRKRGHKTKAVVRRTSNYSVTAGCLTNSGLGTRVQIPPRLELSDASV